MARVCIISHSHYPYDARVSRQARALVLAGHEVDVICLKYEDQPLIQVGDADFVTTCTEQMRERFIERGAPAEKIAVVLNSFDEERFAPERYLREVPANENFTLICHGTIEPNYGLDIVVRAVALLKEKIPGL